MSQANVYTTVSAQAWYTDKCRISTGNTAVTYNVNMLYATPETGNLFSSAVSIPAFSSSDVWVGVGNELTITGSNFTAQEVGTTSSGQVAVKATTAAQLGADRNYGIESCEHASSLLKPSAMASVPKPMTNLKWLTLA